MVDCSRVAFDCINAHQQARIWTNVQIPWRGNMAGKKKPATAKKPPKKTGFIPRIKSTKKNGMGSY